MSNTLTPVTSFAQQDLKDLPDDPALLKQVIAQLQDQIGQWQAGAALPSRTESPESVQSDYALASDQSLIVYGLLELIIDSIPDPVFVKNRQHRWILINQAYCQLVGRDRQSILDRLDPEVLPEEEAELAWVMDEHIFVTEVEDVSEDYSVDAMGRSLYLSTKKKCLTLANGEKYIVGTIRDLTSHKQTEDALRQTEAQSKERTHELQIALKELQQTQLQLIQSEKMSSLGQLVSGLAHELNNPMNFIQGNLEHGRLYTEQLSCLIDFYRQELPNSPPHIRSYEEGMDIDFVLSDLPRIFKSAESGSQRIQKIIDSLKIFSRLDEADLKVVDIHEGLDSVLLLLQSRLKFQMNRISIKVLCDYAEIRPIECYAGAMNQVFINLLMNAIDAIDATALSLQKKAQELGLDPYSSSSFKHYIPLIEITTQLNSDGAIEIKIRDNGAGIPSEIQSRIFDPFFTTKEIGKGTGMGLPLTYQIITEQHGGQITCDSEVGKGTEFCLTIPTKIILQP